MLTLTSRLEALEKFCKLSCTSTTSVCSLAPAAKKEEEADEDFELFGSDVGSLSHSLFKYPCKQYAHKRTHTHTHTHTHAFNQEEEEDAAADKLKEERVAAYQAKKGKSWS